MQTWIGEGKADIDSAVLPSCSANTRESKRLHKAKTALSISLPSMFIGDASLFESSASGIGVWRMHGHWDLARWRVACKGGG